MKYRHIEYFLLILISVYLLPVSVTAITTSNIRLLRIFQGEEHNMYLGASIDVLGDINKDGYTDFAIGVPGANAERGRVDIYFGHPDSDSLEKRSINGSVQSIYFGYSLKNIGDINGDGRTDLLIVSHNATRDYEIVHIYTGNDTGWFDYAKSYRGEEKYDGFGYELGSGDINGDGYSDFIIGAPNYDRQRGKVYIYLGGDSIPDQPYTTIQGDSSLAYFAGSVAGIGDVNNDGYDDFVVGGPLADLGGNYYAEGYFRLYLGGAEPDTIPDIEIYGDQEGMGLGASICAGDFNGDSIDDFIVCSMGNGFVYWGKEDLTANPDLIIGDSKNLIAYLYPAGDINGDSFDDILSGLPSLNWNNGAVDIYLGSQNFDGIYDHRIHGEWASYFGRTLSTAGDVNGDGLDEFLVSESYLLGIQGQGRVYLFSGDSTLVGIDDIALAPAKLVSFKIIENYPNPFNDTTTIRYSVTDKGIYYVNVFNIYGQLIFRKKTNHYLPGYYNTNWNGKDSSGNRVSSGLYLVTMVHDGYQSNSQKILLLK